MTRPVTDPKLLAELNALADGKPMPTKSLLGHGGADPSIDPNVLRALNSVTAGRLDAGYRTQWEVAVDQIMPALVEQGVDKNIALDLFKSFGGGFTTGWTNLLTAAGALLQNEDMARMGMAGTEKLDQVFGVDDPSWFDKLANGLGFMATLLIPGMGVGKIGKVAGAIQKTGANAKALHMLVGASTMSGFEAAMEAGSQIDQKMRYEGLSLEQAAEEAAPAVLPNIIASTAMNLPLFSSLKLFPKAVIEAATEGGQEIYQGYLNDWVMQERGQGGIPQLARTARQNWDSHWEEGGIGAVIGFAAGMVFGRHAGIKFTDHRDQVDKVTPEQKKEREEKAKKGTSLVQAIKNTTEIPEGKMAEYRDEVAAMGDKDLARRLEWLRNEAQGGSTDINTVARYAAAYNETEFRINSNEFAKLESSKIKQYISNVLELSPEDRTMEEDLWAAHGVTELVMRQEIGLEEGQKLATELGVPAWVVEKLPISEEPGVSPAPEVDPELYLAYEVAALSRIGERGRAAVAERKAAKAGKRVLKAGEKVGPQPATPEMIEEANEPQPIGQGPRRNKANEKLYAGVRKATQGLPQKLAQQRKAAAAASTHGVAAAGRVASVPPGALSTAKVPTQTKPKAKEEVSSGKKSTTLDEFTRDLVTVSLRKGTDPTAKKWTARESTAVRRLLYSKTWKGKKHLYDVKKATEEEMRADIAARQKDESAAEWVSVANKLAETVGIGVVWIKTGDPSASLAHYVPSSDVVVMNADKLLEPHRVIGAMVHEVTHGMFWKDDQYRDDIIAAMKAANIDPKWVLELDGYHVLDGNVEAQWDEIQARILEAPAFKPEFWEKLAERSPEAYKNLAERVVDAFRRLAKYWKSVWENYRPKPGSVGGFQRLMQKRGVTAGAIAELQLRAMDALVEAGNRNTRAQRINDAMRLGVTREEAEAALDKPAEIALESRVKTDKAIRALERLRSKQIAPKATAVNLIREVNQSWAASTAEAVVEAATDENGHILSHIVLDMLAGDYRGAVPDGYEMSLGEQTTEALNERMEGLNGEIEAEYSKMNPNQILQSMNSKVATRELGYLMAEYNMLNAELDRRNGGPRDIQNDQEISTLPFLGDPMPPALLDNLRPKRRKNPAKASDGPAMTEALTKRTQEREQLDDAREESAKYSLNFFGNKYVDWVDNLHGLKVILDKGLKDAGLPSIDEMKKSQSPYHTFRAITRAWTSVADSFMNRGVRSMVTGDLMGGKGLNQILTDPKYKIAENYEQFGEYLTSRRLISIADARPGLFATPEARERLALARRVVPESEAAHPNWTEAGVELNRYSNDLVDYLVEAEVLSAEDASKIKDRYSFYAPLHLSEFVSEDGTYKENAGVFASRGVKAMREIIGSNAIDNPLESMVRSTLAMVNAAHHNAGKLNTARVVEEIFKSDPNVAKHIGEIVNLDEFRRPLVKTKGQWYNISGLKRLHKSQLTKKLATMGIKGAQAKEIVTALEIADQTLNEQKKVWYTSIELSKGLIAYIDGGNFKIMRVHPEIYEAISSLSKTQADWITKTAGNFTRLLREGAILSPEFMARNPIRDFFAAGVVAVNAITTPADVPRYMTAWFKAVYQVGKKTDIYDRWVLRGGAMADLVSMDREANRRRNIATMETATRPAAARYYLKDPRNWRAGLRAMSGVMEETTRLAVFKVLVQKNLNNNMSLREAELAAAIESREASVDFQRRGRHAQLMNQFIPFFTATIGGLDKLVRTMSRGTPAQKTAAWLRAGILITVPTLLLWDHNKDEEWYKALPRYEKNMNWHLKLGEVIGPDGNVRVRYVRIPKPFELGLMFGSLFERFNEWATERDPRAMKSWGKQFLSTAQPFHFEQMVPPLTSMYNAANNYDSFRQREIVKGQLKSLPARLQYSENTTTTARMIGDLLNIAPLKVDYYTRSAFGGVGRYVSDILGAGIGALSDRWDTGRMPGREIVPGTGLTEQAPILRALIGSTPSSYDRYSDDFFEFLKKSEGYARELDWTGQGRIPIEQLGRDIENGAVWIALYPMLRARAQEVGKLTRYAKAVQTDTTGQFSDQEKRSITDTVFRARGTIMRGVVEEIDKLLANDERMEQIRTNARAAFRKG